MINRVLLYNSGGGLGDAIQIIPLLNTLKNELKNTKLYYLSAHKNHFDSALKDFNIEIQTLNLNIKYFGFRWWHLLIVKKRLKMLNIESFDLIIDLQTKIRNSLILKIIPHKQFISSTFNFRLSNPKIIIEKENSIIDTVLKAINILLEKNYKLIQFNIDSINKKFHIESDKLLPNKNYVGLSITQGNVYRKKEWPLENIIKFCKKLLETGKIPVFFIEKKNTEMINQIKSKVSNSLFPEHNSDLTSPALVTALSSRLEKGISIDNGIMHMLALAKVPMVVLFGPTNSKKFAPNHKNVKILDSKKLYKSKDISKIKVSDVYKEFIF